MTCRTCGRAVTAGDRFCQWCGTPDPARVEDGPDEAAEGAVSPSSDDASRDRETELRELRAAINTLTAELARLSLRLEALERTRPDSAAPAQPGAGAAPGSPSAGQDASASAGGRRQWSGDAPATAAGPSGGSGRGMFSLPSVDFSGWNWEWLIGGNWLARIGIVALILGVAFFISLAIDRGWLGETERVLLGVAGGLALLVTGEYWRKRYAVWAQTVVGGGLAILYLSVYGAFALYELIAPLTALGAFSLITVAGAVLSLRQEAVAVAVIAILSGFATPLLLQEKLPDERLLLVYVLVLDMGVLALASVRNWRWFTLLALIGSLVLFAFWKEELQPSDGLALAGISAIYLIFTAATVAFNLVWKRPGRIFDLALITLNAAAYYGFSYEIISETHDGWLGAFTVGVAAFQAALALGCRLRGAEQFNLSVFSAGLATVFAVIAVPVLLGGPWVSIAWGAEGLVLVWMSFPVKMRELRWFGYVMFVVSAVWLLASDTPDALRQDLTPFYNEYLAAFAAGAILPALAGWMLHRWRDRLDERETAAIPLFALRSAVFAAVLVPTQVQGVWIAVGWLAESMFFLWLSFAIGMRELRWFAFGLLAATLVRLLGWDTFGIDRESFMPVLNWRFLGFTAGIATLYWAAWLERRRSGNFPSGVSEIEQKATFPALLALANLTTLWLLSAEILASAESGRFGLSPEVSDNLGSMGLSLLWALYAGALITLGVARRWRWVRVAGLALLAAPVVKLFAFDSRLLEQEYRVIAFLALGLLLLAGGLLYQRYSRAVRGFLFE